MDAASIAELVDTRVKELMEQDGFGAAAQQQVNERLDQMAAEQRHTLDGIVKQQNMMSSQLAALCSAFSQNAAAAGAAQPPPSSDDTSPPRDTIADMASLPWLGYQSNVVPPCTGMGLGGVAGPYRGATGIAVGVQTGGAYLPGVENAEAALGIEGIASDATQEQQGTAVGVAGTASDGAQEQQGTAAGIVGIENDTGHEDQKEEEPAKGRGDVEGLPAGESPASGFGNEGGAWKLPVSQERRGDCGTAGQVEEAGGGGVEEEEGKGVEMETGLGKGEGGDGPSVSTTTTIPFTQVAQNPIGDSSTLDDTNEEISENISGGGPDRSVSYVEEHMPVFTMEQSDLPSTLRLRGAPSEDVPEIMQNFRLYVNMNTAYGVSDEVVDRCAVKCLPLLVRGTAANRMQQLQSGTLEWRTQKELAKLDPDGAGVGILAPVLWGEWVNAFTQLFSPDNVMELLARSIVTIKQETDESVMPAGCAETSHPRAFRQTETLPTKPRRSRPSKA
eukprot:jgi/Undpi1/7946/HiC_scaffold_24.g10418.m1